MSELEDTNRRFRRDLLRGERAAASEMVRVYGESWKRIRESLQRLTQQISEARERGEQVNRSWLIQEGRLQALQLLIEREINRFARYAEASITRQQADAVVSAIAHTEILARAAAGAGAAGGAGASLAFVRIPIEAVQDLIGNLSSGSPLRVLLDELGPQASAAIRQVLIDGVIAGKGPRDIARAIRKQAAISLQRALTISRTEVLRAYRQSSRRSYEANSDVVGGWTWTSGLDSRCCAACIGMHGTEHPVTETMATHPSCRCVATPFSKSWAELGIEGVKDTQVKLEAGADWFERQPAKTHVAVLGKAGAAAYKAGQVSLTDFVGRAESKTWGPMYYQRSLKSALEVAARKSQRRKAA